MTRVSSLILLCLAGSCVSLSKFYTETKIVGEGEEQQRCSEAVFERRSSASPTSGVESTVGLGAALLIFIGVGVFAVGIAQAFQMVSYRDVSSTDTNLRSGNTSTTTLTTWTRLSMLEVKCL